MTPFQTLGIAFLSVLWVIGLRDALKRPRPAPWAFVGLLSWGMVLFLWPNLTFTLAALVGIQRGVDLVLYSAVLAGVLGFFLVYLQFRRVNRQLTLVVRELSLRAPLLPDDANSQPS